MIVHNFDPVLIDLGLFQIRWYSIAYIIGIILGWAYALRIIKKTQNNSNNTETIKKSHFDDLLVYLVLGIILFLLFLFIFFLSWLYGLTFFPSTHNRFVFKSKDSKSFHPMG